jgi:hypothetical protein
MSLEMAWIVRQGSSLQVDVNEAFCDYFQWIFWVLLEIKI